MQTPSDSEIDAGFERVSFHNSIKETLHEQRLSQRLDSSLKNIKSCPKEERLKAKVQANHYEAHAAGRLRNAFLCNSTVPGKLKVLSSVTEARLEASEYN